MVNEITDNGLEISMAEHTPTDPFLEHIAKYIIQGLPIPESKIRSVIRSLAKVLAVAVGSCAGVPWANAARQAAGERQILGYIFAISTVISYGAGASWALLNVTRELDSTSSEERQILNNQKFYKVARHITSNILGFLTSLPGAYSAYKYNTIKPLALITLCSSYGFRTYGYYRLIGKQKETLTDLMTRLKSNQSAKEYRIIKGKLIQSLDHTITNILNSSPDERLVKLKTFFNANIAEHATANESQLYLKEILQLYSQNSSAKLPEHWLGGWPRFILKLVGCIIPIITATVNVTLSIESSRLILNHLLFTIFYVILTDAPSFVIDTIAVTSTISAIYDIIFNLIVGNKSHGFFGIYHPVLSKIMPIITLLISLSSAASSSYITYNTLDGITKVPFTVIYTIGGIIFETFALQSLIGDAVYALYSVFGNDETKRLIHFCEKNQKLIMLLNQSSVDKIESLCNSIDDNELRALLNIVRSPLSVASETSNSLDDIVVEPSENTQLSLEDATPLIHSNTLSYTRFRQILFPRHTPSAENHLTRTQDDNASRNTARPHRIACGIM